MKTIMAAVVLGCCAMSLAAGPEEYFRSQTQQIAGACLADVKTLEDWNAKKEQYRQQLAEMLGLWPMPAKTELNATITGKIDMGDIVVENLHYQSMPHLYVTANVYLPKKIEGRLPAIVYVCGHSPVKKGNVSFGNKTAYQHHGVWFAKNGYVCIVLDTLQLGEIEGIHHGLYREKMWWWMSRGYTPAGVEAWNSIRAIDYLVSRPEVDGTKIGITGRSGGGAYSWWTAALDDRIACAVPVAGITDMQNHIVDGTIEGHCDCMFMTNTYRWDFAQVAALIAPRPLLISNSDKDTIFPLDGVERLHQRVARIYKLKKAEKNLGLLITEGPHKDTQELQLPAFKWFNRFLKNDLGPIQMLTESKFLEPEQLRVFKVGEEPKDSINLKIAETFIPMAMAEVPATAEGWKKTREQMMAGLREKVFAGWPKEETGLEVREIARSEKDGWRMRVYEFNSEADVRPRIYLVESLNGAKRQWMNLHVLSENEWKGFVGNMRGMFAEAFKDDETGKGEVFTGDGPASGAYLAVRGVGPSAWGVDEKKRTQILRRYWLIGQTLEGMRVWDVRRAMQVMRSIEAGTDLRLTGAGEMGVVALYASLFESPVKEIELQGAPASHAAGCQLLNILKVMDVPVAAAMAAEKCKVRVITGDAEGWKFPKEVAERLGWKTFEVVEAGK